MVAYSPVGIGSTGRQGAGETYRRRAGGLACLFADDAKGRAQPDHGQAGGQSSHCEHSNLRTEAGPKDGSKLRDRDRDLREGTAAPDRDHYSTECKAGPDRADGSGALSMLLIHDLLTAETKD